MKINEMHRFLEDLRSAYIPEKIKGEHVSTRCFLISRNADGVFGAMMQVALVNDGPVTVTLDSNARDPGARKNAFSDALVDLQILQRPRRRTQSKNMMK